MRKRFLVRFIFVAVLLLSFTGSGIAAETIAISGVTITPSRFPVQPGDPVKVTVNASSSGSSPMFYKFYYCGNYGTDGYSSSAWITAQDYSINNECTYSFPDSGSYVVVIRAVTDPAHEPDALPIAGGIVSVGGSSETVNITSYVSTASPVVKVGEPVSLALNASTSGGNQIYYKFYYCGNYGTTDYATSSWTAVQEYSTVNYASYNFPSAGNYIVVARAVTNPASEPSALPIFGGLITVNAATSSSISSGTLADQILSSSTSTKIKFNGTSISVEGAGATVSGSKVTITAGGSYYVSGTLSDGQIVVNSSDQSTVGIVLNGAAMTCSSSAPLNIEKSAKTVLVLADSTQNSITDAATYVYADASTDEPNAAIFSKDELVVCGNGALTVNGKYNDGIASKDGLTVSGGIINVTSVDDGLRGKDYISVTGGSLTVNAGGDGLKSDNADDTTKGYIKVDAGTLNITSGGDAFDAETTADVAGGTLNLKSGGGSGSSVSSDLSAKGIKGTAGVTIDGGTLSLNSADDALHSNGAVTINGGTLNISTGDDALHADTSIQINGGNIAVSKSYEGIESALITINDGEIHIVASDDGINSAGGTDSSGMIPGPGINPGGGTRPVPGGGIMIPGQDAFASTGNYGLVINGGYVAVTAGGDGIDINGYIQMAGGTVLVNGPTDNGNGPLDYDTYFNMTGGFLVAAGSSGMSMAPSSTSTQKSVLINLSSTKAAGTILNIRNSAGQDILTFAPSKTYQSIAFSSPDLVNGAYEVYLGGTSTGTMIDSLYSGGQYTPGSRYTSFTASGTVTSVR